jgi:hypothetical protein
VTGNGQLRMKVNEAPNTWKGIASAAAVALAGIAYALDRIATALEHEREDVS